MNFKNSLIDKAPAAHDLVLVGGGHSQIAVLKKFGMNPIPGLRITMINNFISSSYSGMLPGYITGTFTKENTQIDLLKLCRFANSRLIIDRVISLNSEKKYISLQNRPPIYYDTLSINTGGEPELNSITGAEKYGVPIKPISNLIQVFENIKSKINNYKNINFVIIGGGAGGIEIALSIKNYLNNQKSLIEKKVTLISKSENLIDGYSALAKLNATKFLFENDINLITDNPVIEIGKNFVKTKRGPKIKSDFSIVVTSITAPKWISQSGLKLSDDGFIEVNNFLQSSNENIFASGDVCSIKGKNLVKSGVYAVRQGPILSKNLRAKILKLKFTSYKPQKTFLSLIGDGKSKAIFSWGPFSFKSKWSWTLKKFIDENFLKKYNVLPLMEMKNLKPHPNLISEEDFGDPSLAKIKCLGCGAKAQWLSLEKAIETANEIQTLSKIDITNDVSIIQAPAGMEIVQSLDLISSIINDPFDLSRIAALHSISDIITAGAKPYSAEAIFIIPPGLKKTQTRLISELIVGASNVFLDHNMKLNGGHTSEGSELQVGFSITGFRPKNFKIKKPQLGNKLILTKPLGVGIILAAHMRGKGKPNEYQNAINTMLSSNQIAGEILFNNNVTSVTDVTGFGLARHALNLTQPYGASINLSKIPVLDGVYRMLQNGISSSLSDANRQASGLDVFSDYKNQIIFDPQTGGGLLAIIEKESEKKILNQLNSKNIKASIIGTVIDEKTIKVV